MRTRHIKSDGRKKGISEAGTSIVEFALVAGVFFMLLFGIIEFSRLMLMYHHVGNAAREGSRYAIVHGKDSSAVLGAPATDADVRNYVRSISPLDPNNVNVTTVWENPAELTGTWVKVTVTYQFNFILPNLFGSGIPLSSTSQMVISY
jgi:Flp pilus assembly protein TadG